MELHPDDLEQTFVDPSVFYADADDYITARRIEISNFDAQIVRANANRNDMLRLIKTAERLLNPSYRVVVHTFLYHQQCVFLRVQIQELRKTSLKYGLCPFDLMCDKLDAIKLRNKPHARAVMYYLWLADAMVGFRGCDGDHAIGWRVVKCLI